MLIKSQTVWKDQGECVLPANQFIEPVLKKGMGSFVWDVDGNKYLDLNCGQFCLCFGHSYPPFIKIVTQQLKNIIHTNTNTLSSIVFEALQKLIKITDKTFGSGILLSTGSEAVEFALRFTKSIKKRDGMIFLNKGYHGLSLGSQSVSSYGKWAFPKVADTFPVSVPQTLTETEASIKEIKQILKQNPRKIAALIMEPILGAGGMIFPPVEFFTRVKDICNKHKIILIFDECQTGFGRTGYWFCYQKYKISPDMLIFAKAAGAGFPVSGVLFTENLANEMRQGGQTHFSSHQNDPLSAAILLFVIEEIEKKKLLARVKKMGLILLNALVKIGKKNYALVNPRGIGLMIAFDLNEKLFTNKENPGHKLVNMLLSLGIIIQCINRGRTFRVMPNFLISLDEINFFVENLDESLKEMV